MAGNEMSDEKSIHKDILSTLTNQTWSTYIWYWDLEEPSLVDSKPPPAISVGEGKSMLDVEPITGVGPLSSGGPLSPVGYLSSLESLSEARTPSQAGL